MTLTFKTEIQSQEHLERIKFLCCRQLKHEKNMNNMDTESQIALSVSQKYFDKCTVLCFVHGLFCLFGIESWKCEVNYNFNMKRRLCSLF